MASVEVFSVKPTDMGREIHVRVGPDRPGPWLPFLVKAAHERTTKYAYGHSGTKPLVITSSGQRTGKTAALIEDVERRIREGKIKKSKIRIPRDGVFHTIFQGETFGEAVKRVADLEPPIYKTNADLGLSPGSIEERAREGHPFIHDGHPILPPKNEKPWLPSQVAAYEDAQDIKAAEAALSDGDFVSLDGRFIDTFEDMGRSRETLDLGCGAAL